MTPMMQVYSIDNGFLLEFSNGPGVKATFLYAKDEKEIAAQVIAQKARLVLEGPKQREMFATAEMAQKAVDTPSLVSNIIGQQVPAIKTDT